MLTNDVAACAPDQMQDGEMDDTTVVPFITPSRMLGVVAAPWMVPTIRTSTMPLAGTVKVLRRFVVSSAVIASSADVALETAVVGLYDLAARRATSARGEGSLAGREGDRRRRHRGAERRAQQVVAAT